MKSARRRFAAVNKRKQGQFVSALIGKPFVAWRWLKRSATGVEIFSTHMHRLMNVAEIVSQQNNGHRFRDLPIVGFRHVIFQNANTERYHVDDVEIRTPYFSGGIMLVTKDGNIREMEVMMGYGAVLWVGCHKL